MKKQGRVIARVSFRAVYFHVLEHAKKQPEGFSAYIIRLISQDMNKTEEQASFKPLIDERKQVSNKFKTANEYEW